MPKAALKLFGNPTDSSSPNGPQLPLGVVMQCSDDGANECADQSSCLHMVTFKDEDWSTASDSQRADVLAKHGFICETLVSQREYAAIEDPAPLAATQAVMRCELSDGRVFDVSMYAFVNDRRLVKDNRASLVVEEIFYSP